MPEYDREEWRMQVSAHPSPLKVVFTDRNTSFSLLLFSNNSHMTCKKCKYEFCWVCMGEWSLFIAEIQSKHYPSGPWSEHGTAWYSCNRYDEKASVDARDTQSKSRASLERYLHVRTLLLSYITHESNVTL